MDRISLPTVEIVPRTVLLVGRTGNGKSSTGNSIIGKSVFKSGMSFSGVTKTLDCQTAMFPDGRVLNVIDTPGLFDFHVGSKFVKNEMMKCIELAKDEIHAVIFVLSLRARFTEEEAAVIENLSTFFGPTITDYMIVLFTGDDCLEKDKSREDYLQKNAPPGMQEILGMCKNRTVFFDNETDDKEKKTSQLTKLLSLVEKVVEDNGGQPYTNSMFNDFKEAEMLQQQKEAADASTKYSKQELIQLTEKIQRSYNEQLKRMTERIDSKLMEANKRLEAQLADEIQARRRAERNAKEQLEDAELTMKRLNKKLIEAAESAEQSRKSEIKMLRADLEHVTSIARDVQNRLTK